MLCLANKLSSLLKIMSKESHDHILSIIVAVVSTLLFLTLTTISFNFNVVKASSNETSSVSNSFANTTQYEIVKKWGGEGEEDGQFKRPHDLDFSPLEDKLYIIDRDTACSSL